MELLLVDAAKGDPGRKGPVGSAGPPGRRAGPPGRRGRTGQIGLPGPKGFGGRKGDTGNQGQIKTSICFCVRYVNLAKINLDTNMKDPAIITVGIKISGICNEQI